MIAREAEVRGGELLKGLELKGTRGAGRPPKDRPGKSEPPKSALKSLGLTPSESKRMQAARTRKANDSTRLPHAHKHTYTLAR